MSAATRLAVVGLALASADAVPLFRQRHHDGAEHGQRLGAAALARWRDEIARAGLALNSHREE